MRPPHHQILPRDMGQLKFKSPSFTTLASGAGCGCPPRIHTSRKSIHGLMRQPANCRNCFAGFAAARGRRVIRTWPAASSSFTPLILAGYLTNTSVSLQATSLATSQILLRFEKAQTTSCGRGPCLQPPLLLAPWAACSTPQRRPRTPCRRASGSCSRTSPRP